MKFNFSPVRCSLQTPLGAMTLAAHHDALVGAWFDGQQHQPDSSVWRAEPGHPLLTLAAGQLQEYFAGQRRVFDLPLYLRCGTEFQQQVWLALQHIPVGSTWSYGRLSQHIDRPGSVRAVAAAIGRNPISVIVPCHRVLGASGALTGYAGGLPRKAALLELESRP